LLDLADPRRGRHFFCNEFYAANFTARARKDFEQAGACRAIVGKCAVFISLMPAYPAKPGGIKGVAVPRVTSKQREYLHCPDAGKKQIAAMPNRERIHVHSTRGEPEAAGWVFVAFCVVSFAATVFLVFLSSGIG
jgi:hypothetical protein